MKNEIKEIISDGFKSAFGGIIANEGIGHASGIIATALHKKGYRKQSDVVKEFAEKLKIELKGLTTVIKEIDKIAASFGGEDNDGQR